MIRTAVVLALLCLPSGAAAQEVSPYSAERSGTPQYRQCIQVYDGKVDQENCLRSELSRQNAFLRLALQENLRSATPQQRTQINAAQRAWLGFRAANCRVRMLNGGSGSGLFYLGCMVRETIARRMELTTAWDY